MKVNIGVDKDSRLIHSVLTAAGNVNHLNRAADLLHGEEEVLYAAAGQLRIAKRPEIAGNST